MSKYPSMIVRVAVTLAVWLVVSFLPLVPVLRAPVVPPEFQRYEWTVVSMVSMFWPSQMVGMHDKAGWATLLVMLGLTGAALLGGWLLSWRLARRAPRAAQ